MSTTLGKIALPLYPPFGKFFNEFDKHLPTLRSAQLMRVRVCNNVTGPNGSDPAEPFFDRRSKDPKKDKLLKSLEEEFEKELSAAGERKMRAQEYTEMVFIIKAIKELAADPTCIFDVSRIMERTTEEMKGEEDSWEWVDVHTEEMSSTPNVLGKRIRDDDTGSMANALCCSKEEAPSPWDTKNTVKIPVPIIPPFENVCKDSDGFKELLGRVADVVRRVSGNIVGQDGSQNMEDPFFNRDLTKKKQRTDAFNDVKETLGKELCSADSDDARQYVEMVFNIKVIKMLASDPKCLFKRVAEINKKFEEQMKGEEHLWEWVPVHTKEVSL